VLTEQEHRLMGVAAPLSNGSASLQPASPNDSAIQQQQVQQVQQQQQQQQQQQVQRAQEAAPLRSQGGMQVGACDVVASTREESLANVLWGKVSELQVLLGSVPVEKSGELLGMIQSYLQALKVLGEVQRGV